MRPPLHEADGLPDTLERPARPADHAAFVDRVYATVAPVYDVLFGPALQAGRVAAIRRMPLGPGTRVLEVGVGSGLNLSLYPRHCRVTGIDLSEPMLEKARRRIAREGLWNVRLELMDAGHLTFADDTFDVVYAPYVISVVPDPVRAAREMRRVCRAGGVVVLLNHFQSEHPMLAMVERAVSPLAAYGGFRSDLDLRALLTDSDLTPSSIDSVNTPPIWSLVVCRKS